MVQLADCISVKKIIVCGKGGICRFADFR